MCGVFFIFSRISPSRSSQYCLQHGSELSGAASISDAAVAAPHFAPSARSDACNAADASKPSQEKSWKKTSPIGFCASEYARNAFRVARQHCAFSQEKGPPSGAGDDAGGGTRNVSEGSGDSCGRSGLCERSASVRDDAIFAFRDATSTKQAAAAKERRDLPILESCPLYELRTLLRGPYYSLAPFRAASIRRCSSARPPKKLRTAAIPSACVGGTRSPPAIHFGSRSFTDALAKRASANTIAA